MTAPNDTPTPGPYAHAAPLYWAAGWHGILPLPARAKKPVPTGYTGAAGVFPSYPDIYTWTEGPQGAGNIALRLPHHIVGIDVDNYDDKPGAATLTQLETTHGPLPATWRSTSRGDGISGIRLYRVPEGLAWPGDLGGGIEIIQHRHRYTVAWPSVHPTGNTYRWINPDGADVIGQIPNVDELPDLPDTWTQAITRGQAATDIPRLNLDTAGAGAWLDQRAGAPDDPPCPAVRRALARHINDLTHHAHARHEIGLAATARLVHLAGEGHPGTITALATFKKVWQHHVTTGAARPADPHEWDRFLSGAVQIAAAAHPDQTLGGDPCDNPFHGLLNRPPRPGETQWTTPTSESPKPLNGSQNSSPPSPASSTKATTGNGPETGAPGVATSAADSENLLDDLFETQLARNQVLNQEIERQRAQRGARRHLDDEEAAKTFRVPVWRTTLVEELAIPDEPLSYLVDKVIPTGANVLLTAQFKAGKTSTVNHLAQCLADGNPFLGEYTVSPTTEGRCAIWNYEVDERMHRRWLRDVGFEHPERVTALNLRGYRLPLVVPRVEDWVVAWLIEHEITTWVVDPFARAFTGSGDSENDNTQVNRFLDTLDVIKARAGVSELVMPTHTGRGPMEVGQERARGATRLDDWADVRWLLTIDEEGDRYFRATGRDVDIPEQAISWDEQHRRPHLTGGGSRRAKGGLGIEVAILDACRITPGIGLNALRQYTRNKLGKAANTAVDEAITRLVHRGRVAVHKGPPGTPTTHHLVDRNDLPGLIGGTP